MAIPDSFLYLPVDIIQPESNSEPLADIQNNRSDQVTGLA